MIELLDSVGETHFVRKEDIIHAHLHDEREKVHDGAAYYGFVSTQRSPYFVPLGKEGVTLALEQLEKLKAVEIAES